jgi:hypothetical protein
VGLHQVLVDKDAEDAALTEAQLTSPVEFPNGRKGLAWVLNQLLKPAAQDGLYTFSFIGISDLEWMF